MAYRGAWATFGIEWNFPVSHNWVTSSPVDFATVRHARRQRLDRGRQRRPRLRHAVAGGAPPAARPRRARAGDDALQPQRPARIASTGGRTRPSRSGTTRGSSTRWTSPPRTASRRSTPGRSTRRASICRARQPRAGPGLPLRHGSREAFMGIYHPRTRAGVAHYADSAELPAKKVWSWGARRRRPRLAQGPLRQRQRGGRDPGRAVPQPGDVRLPRAAGDDPLPRVLAARARDRRLLARDARGRAEPGARRGGRDPGRPQRQRERSSGGSLRICDGERRVHGEPLSLSPSVLLQPNLRRAARGRRATRSRSRTRRGASSSGTPRASTTTSRGRRSRSVRRRRWRCSPADTALGRRLRAARARARSCEGKLLVAYATYEDGLTRFPGSFALTSAAGRLAVALKRYDEASERLLAVEARATQDPEVAYALGVALEALGEIAKARTRFEAAGTRARDEACCAAAARAARRARGPRRPRPSSGCARPPPSLPAWCAPARSRSSCCGARASSRRLAPDSRTGSRSIRRAARCATSA